MNINCSDERDKIFILCEKLRSEIQIDRAEAMKIDSYLRYSESYHKVDSYYKYKVKERIIDQYNNLILVCDEDYIKLD